MNISALGNNVLCCTGSSNPYCVGKNDLLTTGGAPGPVAGGVGAVGALATAGDKEGEGSKTETLPVKDDLTGGKLENPGHQGEKDTSLTTPDQRDQNGQVTTMEHQIRAAILRLRRSLMGRVRMISLIWLSRVKKPRRLLVI